jgi:hypothetical protein
MNYRYYRSETTGTTGSRRFGADMNYRYYRSETGTTDGWRKEAQFGVKMNYRYYRWSLTGTTGRVCSESNSQISNQFVSRSVFGRGKLRK